MRVYRNIKQAQKDLEGSLIIREGISAENVGNIQKPLIPSLYVRVYRTAAHGFPFPLSSITIREGISVFLF